MFRTTLVAAYCLALAAAAQDAPSPPLKRDDVESAMKRIEESTTLDSNVKARVVSTYDQALTELQSADGYRTNAKNSIDARNTAPARIEELRKNIAAPVAVFDTKQYAGATPAKVLAALADAKRKQDEADGALLALRQEADARVTRRQQLADLTAAARNQLDQLKTSPPTASGNTPEEAEANRVYILARAQSLESEINSYAEELASFEARGPVRTLEEDLAEKTAAAAHEQVDALNRLAAANREEQARLAVARADEDIAKTATAPQSIRSYARAVAEENRRYAERRGGPESAYAKSEQVAEQIEDIRREYNKIYSQWNSVYQREQAAGLSNAVGQLLRLYRVDLPSRREHINNIKVRKETAGTAQLEQIELQEIRSEDIDETLRRTLKDEEIDDDARQQLQDYLGPLLTTRRANLDVLIFEYDEYLSALNDLNEEERKLVDQRDTFSEYIDRNVMWVSSGNIISRADFEDAVESAKWLTDWRKWKEVGDAIVQGIRENLLGESFALLFFAGLALARRWQIQRIRTLADLAEKRIATNYWWTVETLLHTIAVGGYLPLVLVYTAWRLNAVVMPTTIEFKGLLADALMLLAAVLASVEIPRQVFRPRGLGEVHFAWEPKATNSSYRILSWGIPIALPFLVIISMIGSQETGEWRESSGRLAFFVLMLIWAGLGYRLTHPKSPGVTFYLPLSIPGEESRTQRILFFLAVGGPLSMAVAAGLGYFDTALRIAVRIHATLVLSFVVSVGMGLAMRALLMTRRKLAIEQARKKRDELREAQKKSGDGVTTTPTTEPQEPEIDLAAIDAQTTRLTRIVAITALCVGVWFIWVEFIPALRVLDQITIGDTTAPVRNFIPGVTSQAGGTPGSAAKPGAAPGDNTIPSPDALVKGVEQLTYADALLALVIVSLTISAARNLPGLLEITILKRLKLSAGERYAIKAVMGYVFVVVGVWLTGSALHIPWMKLQWLVAGLGLGIGFGLQEIFANFISGLIILFEQPVRVGDTVTVDNVSGTVTRIRIRATTIMDGELKELIVPNKEFVTGKLVNWSLSDTTLRTTIPVSVSYNSDTSLVRDVLNRVVRSNARVLKDPAPQVALTKFADYGLVFETRVYVANNDQLGACRDELHDAINEAFREAGISMPLPQQDINIRSVPQNVGLQTELPVPESESA